MRKYSKLYYIPFKINRKEAESIILNGTSYYEQKILNTTNLQTYNGDPIQKKLIPFHSMEVKNLKSTFAGHYGKDRLEPYSYYNAATKSMQTGLRVVTDWYNCSGTLRDHDYELGTKETQIYAGFTYPRQLIENALRNNSLDLVDINNHKENDTIVDPHDMKISYGLEKMVVNLYDLERERASKYIKNKYHADHAKIETLEMHISDSAIHLYSYFVSAYIYNFSFDNKNVIKVVNGCSGKTDGHKIWSVPKFFMTGLMLGLPFIFSPLLASFTLFGRLLLCSSIFSVPSSLYAHFSKYINIDEHERQIKKDKNYNEQQVETDDDIYRQNFMFHKYQNHSNNVLSVPQDTLKLFGLDPSNTYTFAQIKKAYLEQVVKYHPDKYKGDKNFATVMTQQLNNSFSEITEKLK